MFAFKHYLPWFSIYYWSAIFISIIIFSIGSAIILYAAISFKLANTTLDPRQPEKASSLVSNGIFSLSRNPMYLGFLLWLLAGAVYSQNLLSFVFIPLFVILANQLYILPEEKILETLFGDDYVNYRAKVRRWL
jgi:protein-S-isoprenylcysteine O-methyltransferase Ste14